MIYNFAIFVPIHGTLLAEPLLHLLDFGALGKDCVNHVSSFFKHVLLVAVIQLQNQAGYPCAWYSRQQRLQRLDMI